MWTQREASIHPCASLGSSPAGLAGQFTSGGVHLHGTDVGVDWVIAAAEHTLGVFQSRRQSCYIFFTLIRTVTFCSENEYIRYSGVWNRGVKNQTCS